jgi:hypothetical protein
MTIMPPVRDTTAIASVGTTYDTAKKHTLTLGSYPAGSPFRGRLEALTIQVSSISSATELAFQMTTDADGDLTIASGVGGDLTAGITTATDGAVTYVLDFVQAAPVNDIVYVFYKTDAGTVTIDSITITWSE